MKEEDLWKDCHLFMLPLTCFFSHHWSLLLSLSYLMNLICIFPWSLTEGRYLQNCSSANSKEDSSVLPTSSKSSTSACNIFVPLKSLLPLQFQWFFFCFFLSNLSAQTLVSEAWKELLLLSLPPPATKVICYLTWKTWVQYFGEIQVPLAWLQTSVHSQWGKSLKAEASGFTSRAPFLSFHCETSEDPMLDWRCTPMLWFLSGQLGWVSSCLRVTFKHSVAWVKYKCSARFSDYFLPSIKELPLISFHFLKVQSLFAVAYSDPLVFHPGDGHAFLGHVACSQGEQICFAAPLACWIIHSTSMELEAE